MQQTLENNLTIHGLGVNCSGGFAPCLWHTCGAARRGTRTPAGAGTAPGTAPTCPVKTGHKTQNVL